MRIILDTGVMYRAAALRSARDRGLELVIPAVAFAERLRQVQAQGHEQVRRYRDGATTLVEPYGAGEADRIIPGLARMPRDRWRRLARDALIAGHVRPGDELWTTDPEDFLAVGVPPDQIVAV